MWTDPIWEECPPEARQGSVSASRFVLAGQFVPPSRRTLLRFLPRRILHSIIIRRQAKLPEEFRTRGGQVFPTKPIGIQELHLCDDIVVGFGLVFPINTRWSTRCMSATCSPGGSQGCIPSEPMPMRAVALTCCFLHFSKARGLRPLMHNDCGGMWLHAVLVRLGLLHLRPESGHLPGMFSIIRESRPHILFVCECDIIGYLQHRSRKPFRAGQQLQFYRGRLVHA